MTTPMPDPYLPGEPYPHPLATTYDTRWATTPAADQSPAPSGWADADPPAVALPAVEPVTLRAGWLTAGRTRDDVAQLAQRADLDAVTGGRPVTLPDASTGTMPTMTGSTMTKAQQETALGEGLAVGVLALDVEAVTSSKVSVEFAFRRAFRDWPPRSRFPQVRADVERDSIIRILRKSDNRRGSYVAYWTFDGPEYVPVLRQDWSIEECGDAVAEGSGVPFAQWVELAEAFVAALAEDEVRRGG